MLVFEKLTSQKFLKVGCESGIYRKIWLNYLRKNFSPLSLQKIKIVKCLIYDNNLTKATKATINKQFFVIS